MKLDGKFAVTITACLLLLGLVALSVAQPAQANGLDLHLKDALSFDPNRIVVRPSESVSLHLINDGVIEHTFTLFEEKDATVPLNDNAALQQYNSTQPKIVDEFLNPGEGRTITFAAPAEVGNYVFVCMVPGHAAGGMHGVLVVGEQAGGLDPLTIGIVIVVVMVAAAALVLFFLKRTRD
ncbi:MAG: plastocyanin/azurin family copper-binding protein [Thermoplasmata archaeon]